MELQHNKTDEFSEITGIDMGMFCNVDEGIRHLKENFYESLPKYDRISMVLKRVSPSAEGICICRIVD